MRYTISKNITISRVPKSLKPASQKEDVFMVKDDYHDRQFFINHTTKTFLEKFSLPATFTAVNKAIADEVNAPPDAVKKIIQPFFKYIKYRHFIVPEHTTEKQVKAGPLFNPDAILDQYKIENIITVNDDVEVYKAVDLETENKVVIKLIPQHAKNEAEVLKREFDFLHLLKQYNVAPQPYAFVDTSNYLYFVQDFVDGLSLPQFIKRTK